MRRTMTAGLAASAMVLAGFPASAQEAAKGEAVFKRQCAACHNLDGGRLPVGGPTMKGVVGRKAASLDSFRNYTAALRESGIVWDAANLDAFLADPKGFVPGTSQPIAVKSAAERAAVIAFLETVR